MLENWKRLNLLWEPTGTTKNVQARALLRAIASFTVYPSDATLWRGHSSHAYRICPSIGRGQDWSARASTQSKVEDDVDAVVSKAKKASHYWRSGLEFRSLTQIEQLSHLQHHGTPTPLVDLTPDPMVALWMAAQESRTLRVRNPNHGLLIGFNITDDVWKDLTTDERSYPQIMRELESRETVGWSSPPVTNDRIVVQRSRFMISPMVSTKRWHEGVSDVWLPSLPRNWDQDDPERQQQRLYSLFEPSQGRPNRLPVVALKVPGALKEHLRAVLARHYGIEQATLFPDVTGGVE